jgi:hypothetical protein
MLEVTETYITCAEVFLFIPPADEEEEKTVSYI